MSRFQAGALVVYGNLGVHEVEDVGLRRFCDEPAREYYTLRPYFSDSHDRSYIPTEKEAALRPVTPAQQAEADLARIKAEKLPIPAGIQTALAEHYQALLHTNDFYQYLTLFKELGQKQTQQQSRGRKINAMDAYFLPDGRACPAGGAGGDFRGIAAGGRQTASGGFALKLHLLSIKNFGF